MNINQPELCSPNQHWGIHWSSSLHSSSLLFLTITLSWLNRYVLSGLIRFLYTTNLNINILVKTFALQKQLNCW